MGRGGLLKNVILFWRPDKRNGWLSNFYRSPFVLDGLHWETVEHYFQAQKAQTPEDREKIRSAATPGKAKRLAHALDIPSNWQSVKADVMRKALLAKFTQNPELGRKLLMTGDAEIHEDSPYDFEWSWHNNGRDLLGKLLMEVRDVLRDQQRITSERG